MSLACPDCGTVDERGPHTISNCRGVIAWKLAQAEEKLRAVPLEISLAAVALGRAKKVHEACKSDPSRNVSTGQARYAAEQHLEKLLFEMKEA